MSLGSDATLQRRSLGRSGLDVTTLGFGGAMLGDFYEKLDDAAAIDTVTAGLESGITLFDVSPYYGKGLAEHRTGTALRRAPRSSFVLSTKVGRWMTRREREASPKAAGAALQGGGFPHFHRLDYSYDGTMRAFEQSLMRLGVDHLDIVYIHDVDALGQWDEDGGARFREAMNGAYRALEQLRSEGALKLIGTALNWCDRSIEFAKAGDFDVMLLAGRYTLLEQGAVDEFLPLALKKGIGVVLGGVFASGILATGPVPGSHYNYRPATSSILARVERIAEICRSHDVPLADAALQFPLGHPAVSSVVVGAVSRSEIGRCVKSMLRRAPPSLWSDLKSEGVIAPGAPTPA